MGIGGEVGAAQRRRARSEPADEAVAERLGAERIEASRRALVDVLDALGGTAAVRSRRVRPPA